MDEKVSESLHECAVLGEWRARQDDEFGRAMAKAHFAAGIYEKHMNHSLLAQPLARLAEAVIVDFLQR